MNKLHCFFWIISMWISLSTFAQTPPEQMLNDAKKGDSSAQNSLGIWYYEHKENEQALEWWMKSANQENPSAYVNLGLYYYLNKSKESIKWYELGAKHDEVLAYRGLGNYYKFIEPEKEKSIYWYLKASEKGDSRSHYLLGQYYIEQDESTGLKYYLLAEENGEIDALEKLSEYYFEKKDYVNALKYGVKGATKGVPECQALVGYLYAYGLGTDRNFEEARYWTKRGAEAGSVVAQSNLGQFYGNGDIGLPQDEEQALFWFKKAAQQGHLNSITNVGIYYLNQNDFEQAKYWLEIAANNGDTLAQRHLKMLFKKNGK